MKINTYALKIDFTVLFDKDENGNITHTIDDRNEYKLRKALNQNHSLSNYFISPYGYMVVVLHVSFNDHEELLKQELRSALEPFYVPLERPYYPADIKPEERRILIKEVSDG